jgi:hypothetical protein
MLTRHDTQGQPRNMGDFAGRFYPLDCEVLNEPRMADESNGDLMPIESGLTAADTAHELSVRESVVQPSEPPEACRV